MSSRSALSFAASIIVLTSATFSILANSSALIEIPPDCELEQTTMRTYLQDIVDTLFPQSGTIVAVQNGEVELENLPKDQKHEIVAVVNETVAKKNNNVASMGFPESTILYPTMLANPRRVDFSGGMRFHDCVAGNTCTPVTFGDQLPLFRWNNVKLMKAHGDMQLEIEGAIFAIFNQTRPSSPLINADYYVAIPLNYATGRWAHRARLYHISSHLGDEYMKRRHHAKRLNKSYEAIDLFTSYYITKEIRVYGGVGYIGHSDSEMHLKPLYAQYGLEVHAGRKEWKELYGTPYLAMHFQNYQDNKFQMDSNFSIGYEWGKLNGLGKKMRVALEYHNGFCAEGQFCRHRSDYIQATVSWGF